MRWTGWLEPFRFRPFEGSRSYRARAAHRLRRLIQKPFSFTEGYWLAADLAPGVRVPRPRIEVEIREMTARDLPLFGVRGPEEMRAHLEAGDVGFIALHAARHGPEAAYLLWVIRRPVPENGLGILIEPAPDEGYISDCYTFPKYRRNGLHGAVIGYAMSWLKERGYRSATMIVLHDNVGTRRAAAHLGFRIRERILRMRLGSRTWLRRAPCSEPLVGS